MIEDIRQRAEAKLPPVEAYPKDVLKITIIDPEEREPGEYYDQDIYGVFFQKTPHGWEFVKVEYEGI